MTKCIIPDGVNLTGTELSSFSKKIQDIYLPQNTVLNDIGGFSEYSNLVTVSMNIDNVYSMTNTFLNCINLKTTICGNNVTKMTGTYYSCKNLTTALCGNNVTDMNGTYFGCLNITTPVCGDNVVNMGTIYHTYQYPNSYHFIYNRGTYEYCTNLTTAVCGDKVTDMKWTYVGCENLATAVCGPSVVNAYSTYWNATNIRGNAYFYSPNITNAVGLFGGNRNTANRLNVYIPTNSTTLNHFQKSDTTSIVEAIITWSNNTANNCFYNTQYNIYIYPVENIAAAKEANGD